MANIIQQTQKPTLVLAHNKTLARTTILRIQGILPRERSWIFCVLLWLLSTRKLYSSIWYVYWKDASINDEIDKLRHSATLSLFERRDVIIVASVSCIYGLGDPEDYQELMMSLRPGMAKSRNDVMKS